MTTSTANPIYGKLLAKALPKVIQSEKENDRYMKMLLGLEQKNTLTREEKDWIETELAHENVSWKASAPIRCSNR